MKGLNVRLVLLGTALMGAAGLASASTCSGTYTLASVPTCTVTMGDGAVEQLSAFSLFQTNTAGGTLPATGWDITISESGTQISVVVNPVAGSLTESATTGSNNYQFFLSYTVTDESTSPLGLLTSAGAGLSVGSITDSTNGQIAFTKAVFNSGASQIANPSVSCTPTCGPNPATQSFSGGTVNFITVDDSVNITSGNGSSTLISLTNLINEATSGGGGVPEPSTFFLLGGGLVAFGAARWRKKRSDLQ